MQFFARLPIRILLLFLVFISILPASAVILHSGMEQRSIAAEEAKKTSLRLLHTISDHQLVNAESVRQMLMVLTKMPEVQNKNIEACNALFKELRNQNPLYGNIFFADNEGWVVASAIQTKPHSIAKRKYYRDVINKQDFSAGEYVVGVSVGSPVFHFAYPVSDKNGRMMGLVAIALNLKSFDKVIVKANLPEGSNLALTDNSGIRLYRFPENDKYMGRPDLPDMIKYMSGKSDEGAFTDTGVDGTRRFYAYKRFQLRDDVSPYLYMRLGIPEDKALSGAQYALFRNLITVGIILMVALISAWYLGGLLLVDPLNKLVAVTKRFRQGERDIMTGLPYTRNEFGHLAETFDEMTVELRKRDDERNNAEEALKKSYALLKSVLESSKEVIIFALDRQYRYITFNDSHYRTMKRIWGIDIALGNSMLEYIKDPEDRLKAKNNFDRVLSGEFLLLVEAFGDTALERRYYEDIYNPIIDENGDVIGLTLFLTDVTERKRAEEALINAKEEWELTFNAVPDLIALIDANHRIIRANRAMAEKLKSTLDHAVECRCYEVVHGLSAPPDYCPHSRLLISGKEEHAEVVEERLGGIFDVTTTPLHDHAGNLIGSVHVARDITERKLIEGERERLISELQEALSKVKMLNGMLPICASCKKIRNDEGYWEQIEGYIRDRSDVEFSHGICPGCAQKLYPELYDKMDENP